MIRFLHQSKTALGRQSTVSRVHVVLGNEACDLDSAASALTYAYLLSSMDPETLFLPLLNIAEDEYPLKTEVAFFLHKLGIAKDHLIFRPEVDLTALHEDGRLLITLVDRHRLDGADVPLQPCVVQVLDHHEPDRPLSDDVTIEPVGSCCTLVAERLFQLNRNLIDRTVADLLLGTIILDTVNMSAAAQRVTPKDRLMVSFLEPLASGETANQLFEMLQRAKGDVSQLSSFELLRKDQKTAEGGGLRLLVSSVPMLVKEFVRAPDAVSACNQQCQATGRDLVVLMGSRAAGAEFTRDLAVFSARDDVRHQICTALEDAVTPCLGLVRVSSPHPRLALFTQANVAASRKAVLPLLRSHLAAPGGSGELSPVGRPAGRPPPPVIHSGPRPELPPDVRPPNGVDLGLSAQAVTLLEPTSTGGSSHSSAYNSVPYTPQNSVADSDAVADFSLPSFNSRELLQRIELRRGPLGGFEGADDIGAYPFTPKNSFVESSLETAYRQMNIAELDSDMILQKVYEKKRKSHLFDDITEEGGGGGGGDGGGAVGGLLGDRRSQGGVAATHSRSQPGSRHQADTGTMRSDRGPAFGSADLTPADGKSGSTGSLDEAPPTLSAIAAPRNAALGPSVDGSFASDVDDDTVTFQSALSSSEAIRRRDDPAVMATRDGPAAAPALAVTPPAAAARTNGTPSGGGDPAKLWRAGDGRTVRDIVEHGLGGGDSGLRSVSFGCLPGGGHDSLGPDSSGGPESLSQLSLTPLEDDYYEDFTLPGTHEGVMSRQKSFRRRVRAAPVEEPDADRIERLVRAGELERHGSIRRRMVAPAAPPAGAGSPSRFGRDLREVEELMAEDGEQVAIDELPSLGPVLGSSTPKTPGEQPASLPPLSDEPLSIEMNSTMMKIRECLDREKLKDIYTISGRLQDMLTQEDIQEILAHSEMFAELLGEGILAELRSSMSESQQSTPPRPADAGAEAAEAVSVSPPAPAPRNMITVQAEVSAEADEEPPYPSPREEIAAPDKEPPAPSPRLQPPAAAGVGERAAPAPSPRHRITVPTEISSDSDMPRASDRSGPSSLPAEAALRPDDPDEPPAPGALWRSGSLRRLGGGPPVEALFAESGGGPAAGQRRLPAPAISLDDSEQTDADRGDESASPAAKPADADSGVSEGGPADWPPSGEDSVSAEDTIAPVQGGGRTPRSERLVSLSGQRRRKKISVTADVLADDDSMSASSASQLDSDTEPVTPTEALVSSDLLDTLTPDDIETPDELEDSILERLPPAEPIPEYTAREEMHDERSWRTCVVAGLERRIDMKVIEPYKKVLSHGGYLGLEGDQAIIVFSACYLPDRSRRDYSYVMDNLFLYVLTTLDALIAEDYVLIYLHGATQRSCMPSFGWLKRCYQMVDRRLRKNLKGLYLVHPTFWVKTIVALTRPFISSKFSRKLRFVASLRELSQLVPMDHVCIPDRVKQLDFKLMIVERKKQLGIR